MNFRNYSKLSFVFNLPIIILLGDNAEGKSNFLESIYFLATTKSPKAEKEDEIIRYNQDTLHVEGVLDDQTKLEISLQALDEKLKKKVSINGVSRRVSDYNLNLAAVLFSPEDINLVIGSPSLRRAHLDQTISQVDRSYKKAVSDYEGIVTRKNKILKRIRESHAKLGELDFWYDQQLLLSSLIVQKREDFFQFINNLEKRLGQFKFDYLENQLDAQRLKEYQSREVESASSLIGPHRDDFTFLKREKEAQSDSLSYLDLAKFGSRGEQRTAVLDLKLAEVSFMERYLGSRPVLLLDDIFSELDHSHREHVLDISKLQQTIIAAVEIDQSFKKQFQAAQVFKVEKGKISS
ncbi:DNA replication/repair protein RecF [Candidatus Daviesbacteria bacterium]|nr:DNA replication/repair protein RecF [Candidatus Daviesbacteria bacterium]